jgi:DNA-binding CsgD family transcriptional regulator
MAVVNAKTSKIRSFWQATSQYWVLALSIGLLFGWLLSFPLQGPILGEVALNSGIDPLPAVIGFLLGHIVGLVVSALIGSRYPVTLRWFSVSGFACLLLTLLATTIGASHFVPLFFFMGLFASPIIICWGSIFTRSVIPHFRGRVMVAGIAIANIILYTNIQLSSQVSADTLLLLTLPLLVAASAILFRQFRSIEKIKEQKQIADSPVKIVSYWPLLPFIFGVNTVGGLMYSIVSASWSAPGISHVYSVLPYIVLVVVAGVVADSFGRRSVAIIGTLIVGFGFMLYGISNAILLPVVTHTMLIGGFAFMDAFTWIVPADLARKKRVPLFYGGILSVNVLAVLVGLILSDKLGEELGKSIVVVVSIAGILLFAALGFAPALKETLNKSPSVLKSEGTNGVAIFQVAGLTRRELEVATLVVDGMSLKEIQQKLFISPDTLKTHLRNIYGKVGVGNRLELTHKILKSI